MPGTRRVLLPRRTHDRARRMDQALERKRPAVQVDQDRRPDHRPDLPLLLTHLRTGTLADAAEHRARAPWYRTKAEPSTADMIAKLRRVLIAAKYRLVQNDTPTPAEIHAITLAWEAAAA